MIGGWWPVGQVPRHFLKISTVRHDGLLRHVPSWFPGTLRVPDSRRETGLSPSPDVPQPTRRTVPPHLDRMLPAPLPPGCRPDCLCLPRPQRRQPIMSLWRVAFPHLQQVLPVRPRRIRYDHAFPPLAAQRHPQAGRYRPPSSSCSNEQRGLNPLEIASRPQGLRGHVSPLRPHPLLHPCRSSWFQYSPSSGSTTQRFGPIFVPRGESQRD